MSRPKMIVNAISDVLNEKDRRIRILEKGLKAIYEKAQEYWAREVALACLKEAAYEAGVKSNNKTTKEEVK